MPVSYHAPKLPENGPNALIINTLMYDLKLLKETLSNQTKVSDFMYKVVITQKIIVRIDKWSYIKLNNFCKTQ